MADRSPPRPFLHDDQVEPAVVHARVRRDARPIAPLSAVGNGQEDRSGVPFAWPPYLPGGFARRVPLYVYLAANDAALAEAPAVTELPPHLHGEALNTAATSDIEEEI